jgi:hypothetical protein
VASQCVDWFVLALIAFGCPRVKQDLCLIPELSHENIRTDPHLVARVGLKVHGRPCFKACPQRKSACHPRREATIEDSHSGMACIAQRPPGPCRISASGVIVSHHLALRVDPKPAERLLQRIQAWERVAAAIRCDRLAKVSFEIDVLRAGYVAGQVILVALVWEGEVEAAIEDDPISI